MLVSDGILGQPHPVQLHGQHFQVIKMGYGNYNEDKSFRSENKDINCTLNGYCNRATWADPTWESGNIPDIIENSPPFKDTVIVPVGGYTVIRFQTLNPGESVTV